MFRLFNRYWSAPAAVSLVVETGLLVTSVWLAYSLRFWVYYGRVEDTAPAYFYSPFWLRAGAFAAVVLLSFYANGLYDFGERYQLRQLFIRIGRTLAIAATALMVIHYVTFPALTIGRGVFVLAMAFSAILLTCWRVLLGWGLRKSPFGDRLLIVGTDESAIDLAREILHRDHLGYRIVGFVGDDPSLVGRSLINPRVIGTTGDVCRLARDHNVSRVIVAQKDKRGKLDMDQLLECKMSGILVEQGSDYHERLTGRISLEGLTLSWLIFSSGFVVSRSLLMLKRISDAIVAAVGLLLASPLMLVTAIAIRLDSPGPVLYHQERVGLRSKVFTLWKFRSMRVDAEDEGNPQWATEEDPRTTRVGRLIRKTRIDELPQLWNVLVGEMSLVGPRPERKPFVAQLTELSPFYTHRVVVLPGITGWAQIRAPYAATYEDSLEKLEFDLYYIKNLSFLLDASIVLSTIRIVLFGRGGR